MIHGSKLQKEVTRLADYWKKCQTEPNEVPFVELWLDGEQNAIYGFLLHEDDLGVMLIELSWLHKKPVITWHHRKSVHSVVFRDIKDQPWNEENSPISWVSTLV